MNSVIPNLIVVAALSLGTSALAATENKAPAPPATEASAVPATAAAPQQPRPAEKRLAAGKPRAKAPRPKNLDLRHCLELKDDLAIARCAGE